MSAFTELELAYLTDGRRLGRLATVGADGTPHVVPVGLTYNGDHDPIDVRGRALEETKKYRDVDRTGRAAIVVDDLASTDPWRPRGIEVRGHAESIGGPRPVIRIHPERIVSLGIDSDELGARHSRPVRARLRDHREVGSRGRHPERKGAPGDRETGRHPRADPGPGRQSLKRD